MPSVTTITLVGLIVDEDYVGRTVSIRSESDQLYSELINVSVSSGKYNYNAWLILVLLYFLCFQSSENVGAAIGTVMCSCINEVGIAVGAVIVVVCLVVIVIIVIVMLCLWRYV